jgi:hypothetical protein
VQRLAANLRSGSDAGELRIPTVLALSYEVLPRALKALALAPDIAVPIRALRFAGRPDSVTVRSITRCMREAIEAMA